MEELIQFLIKNFYIVLFVLFIFSRFMGKSGGKRNEPRMPDFGGEETDRTEAPAMARPRPEQELEHRDNRNSSPEKVYRSRMESSQPEPEGVSMEYDPYAEGARTKRRSGSGGSPAASARSRPSFASLGAGANPSEVHAPEAGKRLSKRELRNAFIWSEVLGPPKAKQIYRK